MARTAIAPRHIPVAAGVADAARGVWKSIQAACDSALTTISQKLPAILRFSRERLRLPDTTTQHGLIGARRNRKRLRDRLDTLINIGLDNADKIKLVEDEYYCAVDFERRYQKAENLRLSQVRADRQAAADEQQARLETKKRKADEKAERRAERLRRHLNEDAVYEDDEAIEVDPEEAQAEDDELTAEEGYEEPEETFQVYQPDTQSEQPGRGEYPMQDEERKELDPLEEERILTTYEGAP